MYVLRTNQYERSLPMFFFGLGIFFIMFDKMPILGSRADYAPISIVFFILSLFCSHRIDKYDIHNTTLRVIMLWLVLFVTIGDTLIHSLFVGHIGSLEIRRSFVIIPGVLVFLATSKFMQILNLKGENAYLKTHKYVKKSLIIPGILGVLQLIAVDVLRHPSLVSGITSLFAGEYTGRVQFVSSESSWAAMHLMFLLLFGLMLKTKGNIQNKRTLMVIGVFLIMTFSLYGFITLAVSFILTTITGPKFFVNKIGKLLLYLSICVIVYLLVSVLASHFFSHTYYGTRFQGMSLNIGHLFNTDDSTFIRFVSPYIGILDFLQHPFVGTGAGFFDKPFVNLLITHFPQDLMRPQVYPLAFHDNNGATTKNIITQLAADDGLLGLVPFVFFLGSLYSKIRRDYNMRLMFWGAIALSLNFGSYAFVEFWVMLGICHGYSISVASQSIHVISHRPIVVSHGLSLRKRA